jgi:uncharacterized protein (TIGR00730 family)
MLTCQIGAPRPHSRFAAVRQSDLYTYSAELFSLACDWRNVSDGVHVADVMSHLAKHFSPIKVNTASADSVIAHGGEVIGVIPEFLERAEVAHTGLTELHVVGSMHERKALMATLADGFIALPGGFGTLDELAEALTWTQLGLQAKPVVLLDVGAFWEPLVRFFDAAVDHGFVRPAHRMLRPRTVTVDDAIALATSPVPDTPHKWLDRDGTR